MPAGRVDLLDNATCDPDVSWTTGNVAEAFPGLFTTLMYSFAHEPVERAVRGMLHRLGVFGAADLVIPPRIEDQFWSVFAGRAAANINSFRRIAGGETADAPVGTVLRGVAASGGVAQGRARVVTNPAVVELDDGDILVCEATDPGWVCLFLVAGAVVTDHGGMLGHGPIVARELGLPCVCGTGDGSRRIRDGQRIRVDGDRGTVEVLA